MNKIYKLIRNRITGTLIVVCELATNSDRKSAVGTGRRISATISTLLLLSGLYSPHILALPGDGGSLMDPRCSVCTSRSGCTAELIVQPESYGATVDEGFVIDGPVGDFELLLCHGTVCVVGRMRDLIPQLSKSSIYSTKPWYAYRSMQLKTEGGRHTFYPFLKVKNKAI